ncbi:MAG: MFS transporter [Novosphingobium sp.]
MTAFDVQDFVDRQPLSRAHYIAAVLALLAMFVDGFDIFMLGKIAPAIAKGMHVSPAAMTLVFVAQQIGLALGSFFVSPLSDFFGRKRLLVVSFVLFGLLTIAGAFSQTIMQLAVLRGIAGLFLAGVLPAALALVSEIIPGRHRSAVTGLAMAGYSAGNAAGASVAFLVPVYGWQGALWLGGLMALALVPILIIFLAESPIHLAMRRPSDPRIGQTLTTIAPTLKLQGDEVFILPTGPRSSKASVWDVLRHGRAPTTITIWLCYLFSMGNIALLAAWLPTFFQEMAGISIQKFAIALMISLVGGLAGMSSVGFLMDRIKSIWLLTAYFVGNAVTIAALGRVPFHNPGFFVLLTAFSFCQASGQGGLNILLSQYYPPAIRSTGLGWAGGVGRIGGIIAPGLGGAALMHSLSLKTTLGLVALSPCVVVLLLTFVLRPAGVTAHVTDMPDPVAPIPQA